MTIQLSFEAKKNIENHVAQTALFIYENQICK